MSRPVTIIAMTVGILAALLTSDGAFAADESPQSSTMVTFEKAVHFSSPDEADVSIPAGRYDVVPEGKEQLNLTPVGAGTTGKAWSILASPITVPIELPAVAAVALSLDEEQHQVVWLRSDGSGLEAIGAYSGVITRATCDASCQQKRQTRMVEMFSKIMANSHEMKKSLISNMPR